MKRDRIEDFTLFQRREVLWDSELFNFLLKLKYYFIAAKVAGLNDFPHKLLRTEISKSARIWPLAMCAVSFAMTVEAVVFFCVPSLVPDAYALLKINPDGNPIRYLLPLLSILMTVLRYRLAVSLSRRTYLVEIRQIAFDIIDDPVLCMLRVKPWKVRAPLCITLGIISFIFIGDVMSTASHKPRQWKSPIFYAAIVEFRMYNDVNLHAACYVLVIGFYVVLPLLRMTVPEFEEAAKRMDVCRLDRAIRCHETCCRLIGAVDRIAGFYIGSMLVLTVPQMALVISQLDKLSRSNTSLGLSAVHSLWQALVASTFLMLASEIHREAQRPQEILSSRVYESREFDSLSFQFTRRFETKVFGFTFFGFLTIRKQTFLSVLNLITTYMMVALQLELS